MDELLLQFLELLLYIAGCAFCVFVVYLFFISPAYDRRCAKAFHAKLMKTPRLYACHGLTDDVSPENSLSAFKKACDAGYGIKLEVRLSADGIPVVFRDETLQRLCGDDRELSSLTSEELAAIKIGESGENIPSLAEVLDTVKCRVAMIIEIMGQELDERLCAAVSDIIEDKKTSELSFVVEASEPDMLHWFQINNREVVRGQIIGALTTDKGAKPKRAERLKNGLYMNILSRPDFISRPAGGTFSRGYRLCTSMLGCMKLVNVSSSPEDAKKLLAEFDAVIFENK